MNEANDGPIRLLLINGDGNLSGSLQETLGGEPAVELIGEASWAGVGPALDSLRPQLIMADFDASPRDIGSMLTVHRESTQGGNAENNAGRAR